MKFRLLWILFSPLFFLGQGVKKSVNIYHNQELWLKTSATENRISQTLDSLVQKGYYTLRLDSVQKKEKEIKVYVNRGNFYKKVAVKLDSLAQVAVMLKETTITNLDSIVNSIHYYYLKKGYAFNKVISHLDFNQIPAQATIGVKLNNKITINSFVINGYHKLPKGIQKELEFEFISKPYDDSRLKEISDKLIQTGFIVEEKNPQVLFTPDSTSVFLYLKKRKASSFDGILGFGNNESGKFKLNGQLQLSLGNIFNSFETIQFNWLSTPNKSQNFDIKVQVPYLFKSKFGTETALNIYKQDSTFASVKLNQHIYYQYAPYQRIGVEGSFENSRYVLDTDINNNFSKTGIGITYQYLEKSKYAILGNKNMYTLKGLVFRNVPEEGENLTEYQLSAQLEKLIPISDSHYLKTKMHASTLLSDTLTVNELFRIGGLKTIRGFNEQAVYANAFLIGSLEYRYMPFEEIYLNVFADMAWTENKYQNSRPTLFGTGLGISFLTRFGVFTLNYALGKYGSESINFSDSKIHIGIQTIF